MMVPASQILAKNLYNSGGSGKRTRTVIIVIVMATNPTNIIMPVLTEYGIMTVTSASPSVVETLSLNSIVSVSSIESGASAVSISHTTGMAGRSFVYGGSGGSPFSWFSRSGIAFFFSFAANFSMYLLTVVRIPESQTIIDKPAVTSNTG